MEKKVIAIIRTSTIQQEIESQKQEVIAMVLADGYSESEIEVIGKQGASAIKVDDAYQENMEQVYKLINTSNNIQAVYAWGLDRIGRNEEILMKFKNFLISKKIQLIIKEPSLRLLNEDGSVNAGVELAFSLFATMAKQEMEQKKARFSRARNRNDSFGMYNGGYIPFGYKVEDKYIVIDEEEAKIVRLIFNELASGMYSCDGLARELQSRGILFKGKKLLYSNIRGIIKNSVYWGEQKNKAGETRNIPPIISKELHDKAQAAVSANNTSKTNAYVNRHLLGLRLMKCPYCGCHLSVAAKLYQCANHNRNYYDSRKRFEKCPNGISIGVDNLDRLLWWAASNVHFKYLQELKSQNTKEIDSKIEILKQKIAQSKKQIEQIADRVARVNNVYMDGDISEEERDKRRASIIAEKDTFALQIRDFESEIHSLELLKEGEIYGEYLFNNIKQLILLQDKELKCRIVRKHLKNVILEKSQFPKYKRVLKITIQYFNYPEEQYLYISKSVGEFHPLTNGEVEYKNGKPVAIPTMKELHSMLQEMDSEDEVTHYVYSTELRIAAKANTKLEKLKSKYNLTNEEVEFIAKTSSTFFIGTPTPQVSKIITKLEKLKLIVKDENSDTLIV